MDYESFQKTTTRNYRYKSWDRNNSLNKNNTNEPTINNSMKYPISVSEGKLGLREHSAKGNGRKRVNKHKDYQSIGYDQT